MMPVTALCDICHTVKCSELRNVRGMTRKYVDTEYLSGIFMRDCIANRDWTLRRDSELLK